jgi:hypothetical protein
MLSTVITTQREGFGQGAGVLSNAAFVELFSGFEKRTLTLLKSERDRFCSALAWVNFPAGLRVPGREQSLRLDGGRAAHAGRRDRLAIDVI